MRTVEFAKELKSFKPVGWSDLSFRMRKLIEEYCEMLEARDMNGKVRELSDVLVTACLLYNCVDENENDFQEYRMLRDLDEIMPEVRAIAKEDYSFYRVDAIFEVASDLMVYFESCVVLDVLMDIARRKVLRGDNS